MLSANEVLQITQKEELRGAEVKMIRGKKVRVLAKNRIPGKASEVLNFFFFFYRAKIHARGVSLSRLFPPSISLSRAVLRLAHS